MYVLSLMSYGHGYNHKCYRRLDHGLLLVPHGPPIKGETHVLVPKQS